MSAIDAENETAREKRRREEQADGDDKADSIRPGDPMVEEERPDGEARAAQAEAKRLEKKKAITLSNA